MPYAETGPLYGMVWPILISVSEIPGAFDGVRLRARSLQAIGRALPIAERHETLR